MAASSSASPNNTHFIRGYLFIAAATFFWGLSAALGRAVFTGRIARWWTSPTPDRPAHPGPEPNHNCVADTPADPVAEGEIVAARAEQQPPGPILPARDPRAGGLQLLLLFRYPEDERCHGDCSAICRTGVGAAVYAGAPASAPDAAACKWRGSGCAGLRIGGRRAGDAARFSLAGYLGGSL